MPKKLVAQGIGAGATVPIDWQCEGCGWGKAALPESPDPTKVPADVQAEFDAHRCEQYPRSAFLEF